MRPLLVIGAAGVVAAAASGAAARTPSYALYSAQRSTGPQRILFAPATGSILDLSADGRWALYTTGSGAPPGHIRLVATRLGSRAKRVITTASDGGFARWSPNGRRVAYVRIGSCGGTSCSQVWVSWRNGTHAHLVARHATGPTWAPGGRRLAVIVESNEAAPTALTSVGIVAAGGGTPRRITPRLPLASLTWAPRGKWIAYEARPRRKNLAPVVRVIDDRGHVLAKLQNGSTPSWSPDGRWLAFLRKPRGRIVGKLWIARRDGRKLRRLVDEPVSQPEWAPGGRSVAYLEDEEDGQVFVVPARGGAPRQLSDAPATTVIERLWWSRTGRSVLYTARRVTLPD